METEYRVTGMTCEHCARAVTEELQDLAEVTDVTVALVAGGASTVTVTSQSTPDPERVAAAIDEAGYALADSPPA
ncbi:heavy-metal-associated domain-containing protein [Aeromicrobium sp. CF4.19]|uniref:heavy-metal-associated domain-containing protein n=1 Tax=Aeromicrobium sp. CF4.19 TaxID=3373082 RepID=UPI003EE4637C